ncbi:MAG: type II secretion system protein [Gammaproteobacteria bacterium]|nr:type II secretion system protein [Gammaproteobacteria bacterium]
MRRQAAFTLIEILVTLVVIGVAATALLSVFTNMVSGSADPVIQQQATTIAESYMEEILRKPYEDPVVPETGGGGAEAGETRASFNDVQDYKDLPDNLVRDQNNNPVAALADYTVTVNVNAAVLNGVNAMQIDVSVSHAVTGTVSLSAFRTSYPPP